jgi:predicted RNase H-like HicB family nuclease
MKYVYVIERANDGSYSAYVPDLPGCTTCGDSHAEVRSNIKEAVSLYLQALRDDGRAAPPPTSEVDVVEAA